MLRLQAISAVSDEPVGRADGGGGGLLERPLRVTISTMKLGPRYVPALLATMLGLAAVNACGSDEPGPGSGPVDAGTTEDVQSPLDAGGDARNGATTTYYKSGTRLRAEIVGAGEARLFERFFDTKRNEPCELVPTAPGEYRCLPSAAVVHYSDASCTADSAVAVLDPCTKKFGYAIRYEREATCEGRSLVKAIFSVGDALPNTTTYDKSGQECVESSPTALPELHALGAEIPLTEFVKATPTLVSVAPDLSVERLIGEDGSELFTQNLVDGTRDGGCHARRLGSAAAETHACLPNAIANVSSEGSRWANATCTEPAAQASRGSSCPPTEVIVRRNRVDAGPGAAFCFQPEDFEDAVFAPGAPLTTIYRGEACTAEPAPAGEWVGLGAALASTAFPSLERVYAGTGRLRLRTLVKAGTQVDRGGLYDEESKTFCSAQPFADGKLYCLPDDITYVQQITQFKDPACTQPIVVATECSKARTAISGSVSCEGGAYDVNVYPLGERFALATYYNKAETCDPVPNDGGWAYDILPAVPVSTRLAEVTRTRE